MSLISTFIWYSFVVGPMPWCITFVKHLTSHSILSQYLCIIVLQHGRVKVRTTAEQEEIKKRERAKKVDLYKDGINSVFDKVKKAILDHTTIFMWNVITVISPLSGIGLKKVAIFLSLHHQWTPNPKMNLQWAPTACDTLN